MKKIFKASIFPVLILVHLAFRLVMLPENDPNYVDYEDNYLEQENEQVPVQAHYSVLPNDSMPVNFIARKPM